MCNIYTYCLYSHTAKQSENARRLRAQVRAIDTAELLRGSWQDDCAVLCMPGGADLPYCQDLNGHGNKLIRGAIK